MIKKNNKRKKSNINNKGFTLVELLVVIVILGVLVTLGVLVILPMIKKAKVNSLANEGLTLIKAAENAYRADTMELNPQFSKTSGFVCLSMNYLVEKGYYDKTDDNYGGSVALKQNASGAFTIRVWITDGENSFGGKERTNEETQVTQHGNKKGQLTYNYRDTGSNILPTAAAASGCPKMENVSLICSSSDDCSKPSLPPSISVKLYKSNEEEYNSEIDGWSGTLEARVTVSEQDGNKIDWNSFAWYSSGKKHELSDKLNKVIFNENDTGGTYSGKWGLKDGKIYDNYEGNYEICDVKGQCTTANFKFYIDKVAPDCMLKLSDTLENLNEKSAYTSGEYYINKNKTVYATASCTDEHSGCKFSTDENQATTLVIQYWSSDSQKYKELKNKWYWTRSYSKAESSFNLILAVYDNAGNRGKCGKVKIMRSTS